METQDNIVSYNKKWKNIYNIIFFVFVLLITISLVSYNYFLNKDIAAINNQIELRQTSITNINKDENINLYNLINVNRKILEKLEKRSQVITFIEHLNKVKNDYRMDLKGFSYSDWILSSSVTIINNTDAFAYNLAETFISSYRKNEKNIFELWFINSIKWNDNIKFNVEFKLKD